MTAQERQSAGSSMTANVPATPPVETYVFWTNIQSIHLASFIRSLASTPDVKVFYAYEEDLPPERIALGWYVPDFGLAKVVDVRRTEDVEFLCRLTDARICHCFGAYFNLALANKALKRLSDAPCRRVWISESFDLHGWRGLLRKARLSWLMRTSVRYRFSQIFAMGQLGVDCFTQAGMPTGCVKEFAYLSQLQPQPEVAPSSLKNGIYTFVFIGQLIARKGADILIRALAAIDDHVWRLVIIGDGPERQRLNELASQLGLGRRIEFMGPSSNESALAFLQHADCLVLPSRFDGWGAVVNEALLAGCHVVVSDRCGAATLVSSIGGGTIVPAEDLRSLERALMDALSHRIVDPGQRNVMALKAARALDPAALANYFRWSIKAGTTLLSPPWRETK